jgi:hyperosmotically inducible protein
MKTTRIGTSFALALALLAAVPVLNMPRAFASPTINETTDQSDQQLRSDLAKEFSKDRFKNVHIGVNSGVVTLTGSVDLFADKEDAYKRARHAKNFIALRDELRIGGARISDQDLRETLVQKLTYDRVGYGTTTFNAISVDVRDGVVRLGGHAYGPMDSSSALSAVSYTPGVQDVIDEIQVDPTSPMDDGVRLKVARAVYGYPSLNRYAIDPARPIRISVQNGNVTLFGVVDTAADRDMANIRANSVPGVFKVTNELQVGNDRSERD